MRKRARFVATSGLRHTIGARSLDLAKPELAVQHSDGPSTTRVAGSVTVTHAHSWSHVYCLRSTGRMR